jgi:hypothetical protein
MDAREASVRNLNMIPQDMDAQEEAAQETDAQEAGVLDLNMIPQEMDAQEEAAQDTDPREEAGQDMDQEGVGHPKPDITNEQRFGICFALEVINSRDRGIQSHDKVLIAFLLNTSV